MPNGFVAPLVDIDEGLREHRIHQTRAVGLIHRLIPQPLALTRDFLIGPRHKLKSWRRTDHLPLHLLNIHQPQQGVELPSGGLMVLED